LSLVTSTFEKAFGNNYKELRELLVEFGELKSFKKGEFIIKEGEPAYGFYWVLKGGAKVSIQTNTKTEQIVTVLSSADFVGISAVMERHLHNKSAYVLSDSAEVLFISQADFFNYLQKYPMVVLPLLKHIEEKIERIEKRAAQIMRKTIEQRLAYVLIMLQKKFGSDEQGFLEFQLSPKDLANFIGTTRTTVYRVLRKLQDNHIVNSEHKRVQILQSDRLQELFSQQAALV
jgi:CRP-like cAMP-binding protein